MDLAGKSILITGASRGIGAATAVRLARAGMAVALSGRDAGLLDAVAGECEAAGAAGVAGFAGDITDDAYSHALPHAVAEQFGGLDALFNNAGVLDLGPAAEADLASWDRVMDVNFRAWTHLTHHAVPLLTAKPESAIINLCSVSGRVAMAGAAIYCASKHAVHAWSQALFDELREQGVKVSALYPGYVRTDMTARVDGDHAKMIQPDDIAQTVEFVLRFPGTGCPTEIVIRPQRAVK